MSVTSISLPQTISATTSTAASSSAATSSSENVIECIIRPKNFLFLIPTITGIAMGIIFLPNFGLGLAAGAGMLVVTVVAMSILTAVGLIEKVKERRSEYGKMLAKESLVVALFGPIQEEAIFRGGFQPLITHVIQLIVPAASAVLFGPFSIATTVSIVATGVFFGALHYLNPHKAAFQQAVTASIGGIAFGALAAQYGIAAAVAAHIANNTIVAAFLGFAPSSSTPGVEPHSHRKFRYTPLPT